MQETRRQILEILRERGQATVDDIVAELHKRRGAITPVTVRHHLVRLQEEDLITTPELRRRTTPGRPQHMYALTEKASAAFPNNYQNLASKLIEQMKQTMPATEINVILEGVATGFAAEADIPDVPWPERLDIVADYLTQTGYKATWEQREDGYFLHTTNCPYHYLNTHQDYAMCEMDMRLIARLLGVIPRRVAHMADGDQTCSYFVPHPELAG